MRVEARASGLGRGNSISPKHLHRYITEFATRHNMMPMSTPECMESVVQGGVGNRFRFKDLVRFL